MTRRLLPALAIALTVACGYSQSTDPLSSTKPDPVAKAPSADGGWVSMLQMLGAVVVVGAAVRWGLPRWLKTRPRGQRGSSDGTLRVLETVACGQGSFHVIEATSRQFLVATGPSSTTLLAELTPKRFEAVLDQVSPPEEVDIRDRVAAAAARLDQLVGH